MLDYLNASDGDRKKDCSHNEFGKPAIGKDLTRKSKNLFVGFFNGMSGLVLRPLQGAQERGFPDFLSGTVSGAVGVVTLPTSAFLDFVGASLGAVKE